MGIWQHNVHISNRLSCLDQEPVSARMRRCDGGGASYTFFSREILYVDDPRRLSLSAEATGILLYRRRMDDRIAAIQRYELNQYKGQFDCVPPLRRLQLRQATLDTISLPSSVSVRLKLVYCRVAQRYRGRRYT